MIRRHQTILGRDELQLLCVCVLLLTTLCQGVYSKHGGYWGHGKGGAMGGKHAPMYHKGSSKSGLKVAGAAAAGALGGAAVGYGLGSLGRPGYGWDPADGSRRYHDRPHYYNGSDGRYYRGGASSGPALCMVTTLGASLVPLLTLQDTIGLFH